HPGRHGGAGDARPARRLRGTRGRYADLGPGRQPGDAGLGGRPAPPLYAARLSRLATMIHFIGDAPGAPDLITVRGLRLIERCPVCLYAGSLVPTAVIAAAPETARVIDTSALTLDEIIAEMREAHGRGLDVARVHSGDL